MCAFCFVPCYGQNAWSLTVDGTVLKQDKKLEGAVVSLVRNGSVVQTFTTPKNGKFSLDLLPDGDYLIKISMPGHVTKSVAISTRNVPIESIKVPDTRFYSEFETTIFEDLEGIDYSILDQPAAKMYFDRKTENFEYDMEYINSIKTKVEQLQRAYEQKQKEELLKQQQYSAAIAKGDKALSSKDYNGAKGFFTEAAGLKPKEQYPKEKLAEIEKLLAEQNKEKELEASYNAAIASADKAFDSKDYQNARVGYNKALTIKSEESHPKNRLAEIEKILADQAKQKELETRYTAAIAKADKAFDVKDYPAAKTAYNEALAIKANETHPTTRLAEIEKLLAEQAKEKELEKKYAEIIEKADNAFEAKDYATAKTDYSVALTIKANESHPKNRLSEIERILADQAKQKELDASYQLAISKADRAYESKDYLNAKAAYSEALTLKPGETYPANRIAEIEEFLAAQAEEKELNEKYSAAIASADKAFTAGNLSEAKSGYNQALAIKPQEIHPKTRLTEIEKLLADQAKEKERDANYTAAIDKADKAFNTKDFTNAKAGYSEALTIKPGQSYPTERLTEIERLLAEQAKEKELENAYSSAIATADNAFDAKDYTTARAGYNKALTIKPNETHPQNRLQEIEKIFADQSRQKEVEARYNAAITKADQAFLTKNYTSAKEGYNEAIGIKPAESHPKDRLTEIEKILAEAEKQKELEVNYAEAIARGDKAFKASDYNNARSAYQEALGIKPGESHPKNRLSEIQGILAKAGRQKEIDSSYTAALVRADQAFVAKDYSVAKSAYSDAISIKPGEQHPKNRLTEIEKILAEREKQNALKAIEEKYNAAIISADKAFDAKNYPEAKTFYNEALSIKAHETHPKNRLSEINKLLSEQLKNQAIEEKYSNAISAGDNAFGEKKYELAKNYYNEAKSIKPTETYPTEKLNEIYELQKLAAENAQAELEAKYQASLKKGDDAFSAGDYEIAKNGYREALSAKPGEAYPTGRITEIDSILNAVAKRSSPDEQYNDLIKDADVAFSSRDYITARELFEKALSLKPAESYPKTRLSEVERLHKEQLAENTKQKSYNEAIARADRAFIAKSYKEARTAYSEALAIIPNSAHPENRIREIDDLLNQLAKKAEENRLKEQAIARTNALFDKKIKEADAAFMIKSYQNSKTLYQDALVIKPGEKYPQDRINEINRILAQLSKPVKIENVETPSPVEEAVASDDLMVKYPEGVTEELYEEGSKKIVRRIVVRGNEANEYKKIIYTWGTYYFKNNELPISEYIWNKETTF